MGDPIVELPLGDPKRLAVFQNPPLHTTESFIQYTCRKHFTANSVYHSRYVMTISEIHK